MPHQPVNWYNAGSNIVTIRKTKRVFIAAPRKCYVILKVLPCLKEVFQVIGVGCKLLLLSKKVGNSLADNLWSPRRGVGIDVSAITSLGIFVLKIGQTVNVFYLVAAGKLYVVLLVKLTFFSSD